ncbi:MAG: hypothetical protein QF835_03215 [Candidatus Marinimicrobia bacterium]|jgi:homoserine kinase|nr:hypothetical protein [Candidatus Neomarinimicrobiota bacterium]|tara:strand:+ start:1294 stop:1461 length:168 start_codon:yes stop_codon:yes gene_type:complete
MANDSIQVRATASVANVSCGFDCIGYAISDPTDVLTIKTQEKLTHSETRLMNWID